MKPEAERTMIHVSKITMITDKTNQVFLEVMRGMNSGGAEDKKYADVHSYFQEVSQKKCARKFLSATIFSV